MIELPAGIEINGTYRILRPIGAGGMGAVYEAEHLGLNRTVALKFLLTELVTDKKSLLRFERESKILMSLQHKNLVKCYQFGVWQSSHPFIAMELLDGHSFKTMIEECGRVAPLVCLDVAIQACDGLEAIHSSNFTHRDIKPENLFIQRGPGDETTVKIIDFGLAGFVTRSTTENLKLTQTGALVGSIFYLAPELCQGNPPDHRSDIYSLGCVIYEALAGEPPLIGDDPIGMIYKHVHEYPVKLSEKVKAEFPPGIDKVLSKAMCKNPANRYQSAAALKTDLLAVRDGVGDSLDILDIFAIEQGVTASQQKLVMIPLLLSILSVVIAAMTCVYLCSDDGFVRFGNMFRAVEADKPATVGRAVKYANWLGETGHRNAQKQFLYQQCQKLRPGTELRLRMLLNLSRLEAQEKQHVRQRELLTRAFDEISRTDPGRLYVTRKPWTDMLVSVANEAIDCTAQGKGSRWYFDKSLDKSLGLLLNKLYLMGDMRTSVVLRRLRLCDASLFKDKTGAIRAQAACAGLLRQCGDLDEADLYLVKLRDMARDYEVLDSTTGLQILSELAAVSRDRANWKARDTWLTEGVSSAKSMLERVAGTSSEAAIAACSTLAILQQLCEAQRFEEAAKLAALCTSVVDAKNPRNDDVLSQLDYWRILALGRSGAMSEAVSIARQPSTVVRNDRAFALALVYRIQHDYRSAEAIYRSCYAKAMSGERKSGTIAQCSILLSGTLLLAGRNDEAIEVLEESRKYVADSPGFLAVNEMAAAEVYQRMHQYSQSETMVRRCIQDQTAGTGAESSETIQFQLRRAVLLINRSQCEEADRLLRQQLGLCPPSSSLKGRTLEALARCDLKAGDYTLALKHSREALAAYDHYHWKGEPGYLLALASLVEAAARKCEFSEADRYWRVIEHELPFRDLQELDQIHIARAGAIYYVLSGKSQPNAYFLHISTAIGHAKQYCIYKDDLIEINRELAALKGGIAPGL